MNQLANPFYRKIEDYKRIYNPLEEAIKDSSYFLHIKSRRSLEECRKFIETATAADGVFPSKPANVKLTKRLNNGDRVKHHMRFDQLMAGIEKTNRIFSPNMVVYENPKVNRSFLSKMVVNKKAERNVVKKKEKIAKMEGNTALMNYYYNLQVCIKTLNNSLSGAHSSPHNPHYLKTGHSSLTSSTRITTSYSNASAERLLAGNRHYYNVDIVIQNIVSICRNTDFNNFHFIMEKYNLYLPNIEDVMEMITRSAKKYWRDDIGVEKIYELVTHLTPLEKAAVLYTGDLYHLRKHNDVFVREWFKEIITAPREMVENPEEIIKRANEDIIALCGIICKEILRGTNAEKLKESNYNGYVYYASVIKHTEKSVFQYSDLISLLFASDNMPSSIYYFPYSIREIVVGSDTDSTMYTCQNWVEWYCGKLMFDDEALSVSATAMFINTQVTMHMLAMISRQIGVEDENMFLLRMKNEYSFLIYMVANRSKHYVTLINAKEGNIYKKSELDLKGVALKDSKNPPVIMNTLEQMFKNQCDTIMRGEKISVHETMQRIANIEHVIIKSIKAGDIFFYSKVYIKTKTGYKKPMISNYAHYDLWENVFALKFGAVSNPPIQCIKIPNTLDTNKKFITWVETLDQHMKENMYAWMERHNKKYLGQFILPIEALRNGVPKEFISAIDIRSLIKELMQGFYVNLEILGIYMRNDGITRLLSDDKPYVEELGTFLEKEK